MSELSGPLRYKTWPKDEESDWMKRVGTDLFIEPPQPVAGNRSHRSAQRASWLPAFLFGLGVLVYIVLFVKWRWAQLANGWVGLGP